jgi:hypothetical protein
LQHSKNTSATSRLVIGTTKIIICNIKNTMKNVVSDSSKNEKKTL